MSASYTNQTYNDPHAVFVRAGYRGCLRQGRPVDQTKPIHPFAKPKCYSATGRLRSLREYSPSYLQAQVQRVQNSYR